jgi:four helix bundle protein
VSEWEGGNIAQESEWESKRNDLNKSLYFPTQPKAEIPTFPLVPCTTFPLGPRPKFPLRLRLKFPLALRAKFPLALRAKKMFANSFEDLRIWQQARELVRQVYGDFQETRDYGFKDQIQRAAISIMNNIAEGFERKTPADFGRFLDIAKASCGEVRSMYYTAEDLDYITSENAATRRSSAIALSRGIAAFRSKL